MTGQRTLAAIFGVVGAVCLVLVQFLSWGGVHASGGGFSFSGDAYTWRMEFESSGSFGGFDGSDSEKASWYSDDVEDDEGETDSEVMQIRFAIPLLLAGLVLAALGVLLAFATRGGGTAGLLILLGGIAATLGTILFAVAVDGLFDSDHDWGSSFYLAIVASASLLIGGVLGLTPAGKSSA